MIIPAQKINEVDETLEVIWTLKEQGEQELEAIKDNLPEGINPSVLEEMVRRSLINIKDGQVSLTPEGKERAKQIIRRHRLAERLLVDVLETDTNNIEDSACEFEHILSEKVTDSICTLLGHPRECPHGLPIPKGKCCLEAKKMVESIIVPLTSVNIGELVTVAYILTKNHPRLHRLMSFGIAPGVKIKVHQRFPSYVIQVAETQIALEEEIAQSIYVRRDTHNT